ncbi:hypothetical protein F5X99DRAFT_792 [Biscogniauxia marginata]|nr:hypothetical protein F5X99DRAFT_792 [Biscogniauxia marginata]
MPERRVTFQSSSPPRGSMRTSYQSSRESNRDSGFGSLSSDQAGAGRIPDRAFTAQDYNFQLNSIPALQEALTQSNERREIWKNRYYKKEQELSDASKIIKILKADLDKQHNQIQELESTNADLEDEIESWTDQYRNLSHGMKDLEEENQSLRQTIQAMPPASSQPAYRSSGTRSRQERESKELTDRMKKRLNRNRNSSSSTPSRHSTHQQSVSIVATTGSNSSRDPYVEVPPAVPSNPPASRRSGNNPTTSASIPRGSRREVTAYYPSNERPSGDYFPHPLPDRTRRQG